MPILQWLLREVAPGLEFAEPGFFARVASKPIADQMRQAAAHFRSELLFVHRDAEGADPDDRRKEIPHVDQLRGVVKVVPVRMTEAWLLFDEAAIRRAADRPTGRKPLPLPPIGRLEHLADPKAALLERLLFAAQVSGRRRKRFKEGLASRVHRVAELVEDYAPLRQLSAFQRLERDCREALEALV